MMIFYKGELQKMRLLNHLMKLRTRNVGIMVVFIFRHREDKSKNKYDDKDARVRLIVFMNFA